MSRYTPIHGEQAWWHSNVSAYFLKLFFMNWIQYAKLIVATILVGHQLRANKYGIGIHNNSLSVPFVDIAELCEIVFGFDNSSMSHSNKLYSPSKEFKGGVECMRVCYSMLYDHHFLGLFHIVCKIKTTSQFWYIRFVFSLWHFLIVNIITNKKHKNVKIETKHINHRHTPTKICAGPFFIDVFLFCLVPTLLLPTNRLNFLILIAQCLSSIV